MKLIIFTIIACIALALGVPSPVKRVPFNKDPDVRELVRAGAAKGWRFNL